MNFTNSTVPNPRADITLYPRINSGAIYRGLTSISPQTISATDTIIPVSGTENFPSSGYLLIDAEIISYSGTTANTFTGCVRGALNTTAESHLVNTTVSYYTSQSNVIKSATYPVEQFTGQIYTRVRGRQMSFRIGSNTMGTAWQLGAPRIDVTRDGRR